MRPARYIRSIAGGDPGVARTLTALVAAVFVQGVGASAVLPLLPLFLRRHGTSEAAVGAVMASFFVAGVLTQYLAGHVTDRTSHRRVIVGGLVVYAVASVGYLASLGPGGYVTMRGLQGVGSGAVQVASLALVGRIVALERRGRAYSLVFAAQLAGMALGPLAGSIAGVGELRWLFLGTAVASLAATAPVLAGVHLPTRGEPVAAVQVRLDVSRALVGVLLVALASGLVTGVYETCWTLLLNSRGASAWQIGVSWTLFAIPFALVSPIAGRLADRVDRRTLVIAALVAWSAFAAIYPFLHSVAWLLGLGALDAVGVAIALPAAQSMLSQTAAAAALGRAQGLFTTAETASIAITAGVSGFLFSAARWTPFVGAAVLGGLIAATLPVLWRGVAGRVSAVDVMPAASAAEIVVAGGASTTGRTC
jgi:DHA1 family multidrug resistance protein-like MFS transporter